MFLRVGASEAAQGMLCLLLPEEQMKDLPSSSSRIVSDSRARNVNHDSYMTSIPYCFHVPGESLNMIFLSAPGFGRGEWVSSTYRADCAHSMLHFLDCNSSTTANKVCRQKPGGGDVSARRDFSSQRTFGRLYDRRI